MSWGTCTFSQAGGTGGETRTLYYQFEGAAKLVQYWATAKSTGTSYRITSCRVPTRIGYRFLGYYDSTAQFEVADSTGVLPTMVLYGGRTTLSAVAKWEAYQQRTLSLDANGGTVTPNAIHVRKDVAIGELPTPSRSGFTFSGWFTSRSGGTEMTEHSLWPDDADGTIYAHWTELPQHTLTLNPTGGEVNPSTLDIYEGDIIGTIPEATRDGWYFDGWFTESEGGTAVHSTTVYDWPGDITIYAHWALDERYTLTLNANGGTVQYGSKQVSPDTPIGELPIPDKYANTFVGWFTAVDGGTQWGEDTIYPLHENATVYAHWIIDPQFQRILSFDADGGTVTPSSMVCTYLLPIDPLPVPAKQGKIFAGWFHNGTEYTSGATCDWSGTMTVSARWLDDVFGRLTDYFDLDSDNGPLMLVKSDSGISRTSVETAGTSGTGSSMKTGYLSIQNANSSIGGFELGGILRNPVCTYRIRKAGTVQIQLGKAYGKATVSGTGTSSNPYKINVSGFMLIQAEYTTSADGDPLLIVRGVANEGFTRDSSGRPSAALTNAINMWSVYLSVTPDHIAQDPLGAVNGGGEMTECKTLITCDPVVPMECGMPCASDVVHGKIIVTATTASYFGESAPTARTPFVETAGTPDTESDVDYTTYAFTAERSL